MMKFERNESKFFTTWTDEINRVRVLLDKADKGFYKYQVQKFNGKTWEKVRGFHSLKEAKIFCEEI